MVKKKNRIISNSFSDGAFDLINIIICCLALVVFIWPLWFVVIASFSDPVEVNSGSVLLWIKGFQLNGYKDLLRYEPIWIGFRNSIIYTVVGTIINMVMTVLCAYPLSRKDWGARNLWTTFCLITMYFSGGLIPTYLVVKGLGLIDTVWAMIIPGALSFYNALIVRNYLTNSIPNELFESAKIDGANHWDYLIKIALPLSKPVLAVVALYYAVGHWNDFYSALIYIYDRNLLPLQSVIKDLMATTEVLANQLNNTNDVMSMREKMEMAQTLKYSTIIVSVVPMLIIYPFVQKYFVKGTMVGAVKG